MKIIITHTEVTMFVDMINKIKAQVATIPGASKLEDTTNSIRLPTNLHPNVISLTDHTNAYEININSDLFVKVTDMLTTYIEDYIEIVFMAFPLVRMVQRMSDKMVNKIIAIGTYMKTGS